MERFLSADSGVYCGPLKLLAVEVFQKANARGTVCDLVTGEERRCMDPEGKPSSHVACTGKYSKKKISFERTRFRYLGLSYVPECKLRFHTIQNVF